jgi:MobA-like NTP transferase protein
MNKPILLVLAAGIGSRYGGFKQIEPIGPGGEVILDYSIYDALRAGFGRVVIVTIPALEQPLREHFAQTLGAQLDVTFTFQSLGDLPAGFAVPEERKKPWGTAHAIWSARAAVDGPFGVINADDFYGPGSYRVLRDFLVAQQPGEYCMVGFELAKTLSAHGSVSRGICRADARGDLVDVVEHVKIEPYAATGARSMGADGEWHPLAPDSIASMNMWGFDPSMMAHLDTQFREFLGANIGNPKAEFFIPTVVDTLIKQGECRCRVLKSAEQWFGVTYKQDREQAATTVRGLVEKGVYPASLRD